MALPFVTLLAACGPPPPDAASLPDEWREPTTGMAFVLIRPGDFDMGLARPPEDVRPAPVHHVTLTRPFYIGRFEVTQREWAEAMDARPSQFADCGDDCPVETVSWLDVQDFLSRLNRRSGTSAFRLPTEAEWEFVCRSGGEGRYGDGVDTLTTGLANYNAEIEFDGAVGTGFLETPTPVGAYPPNPWGLYDVLGNVFEWTQDEYCPYPSGSVTDPWGYCGTDTIPIRGGSWLFSANAARCGRRYTHARADSGYGLGFRVVREVESGARTGR